MNAAITLCSLVLVASLPLAVIVGCQQQSKQATPTGTPATEIGALPVLYTGDRWVSKVVCEGVECTETLEVTGDDVVDGKECYVMQSSFEPPLCRVVSSALVKIDKETMFLLWMQTSGEYEALPFTMESRYSYEVLGEPYYPLEVGKECKVIETGVISITMMGETQKETEIKTYTNKVEGVEEITVPAGTFECFRIIKYNEAGNALETWWESAEVKQYSVKYIDHVSGDSYELVAYSMVKEPSPTPNG